MQQICDQIQQRLEEKQLQDELKEQERQQIREKQERMNLEDLKVPTQSMQAYITTRTVNLTSGSHSHSHCQALEKKRAEQQHLHEEVLHINAETMRAKEKRREEEKLADMRDMEYIQKKMVG